MNNAEAELSDEELYDRAMAAGEKSFPIEVADRLLAGENAAKVCRNYRRMTQKNLTEAAGKGNSKFRSVQREVVGADDVGRRLDNFLLARVDVPRQVVYRWIRTGQIRVNRGRAKPSYRLRADDEVRIPPHSPQRPTRDDSPIPDIPVPVLYEDEDLLVVDKPAGLAVHGGSRIRFGLIDVLRQYRGEDGFLELAHRLDRGSSGCLILARSRGALLNVQTQLRKRAVQKIYWALVAGQWRGGAREIRRPLRINRHHAKHRKAVIDEGGMETLTRFRPLEQFAQSCLMEACIETGRTHQIRVHANEAGHPIVGDDRYGSRQVNHWAREQGFRRLFLHARSLGFAHPTHGSAVTVRAPLDPTCKKLLAALRRETRDGSL